LTVRIGSINHVWPDSGEYSWGGRRVEPYFAGVGMAPNRAGHVAARLNQVLETMLLELWANTVLGWSPIQPM
jgi:hypothetical protein